MFVKNCLPVAVMLGMIGLSGCQTTKMQEYNPFAGVRDTFEGKYIDHVQKNPPEPGRGQDSLTQTITDFLDSEDEESVKKMGQPDGVTIARLLRNGIVRIPRLENRLNDLAGYMIEQWPGDKPEVIVYLEPSDEINARAEPDGTIFIPLRILYEMEEQLETGASTVKLEDAIAALLAHEVSHILLRHHDDDHFKNVQKRAYGVVSTSINMASSLDKLRQQIGSGQESEQEKLLRMAMINYLSDWATNDILVTNWSREAEDEADLLAADLMHKAGYDVNAFEILFNTLRAVENAKFEKHEKARKKYGEAIEKAFHDGSFQEMTQGGLKAIYEDMKFEWNRNIASTHEDAAGRWHKVSGYYIQTYEIPGLEKNEVKLAGKPIGEVLALKSSRRVYESHKAAQDAVVYAGEGKTKEADKSVRQALVRGGTHDPFIRLNLFKARREQGKVAKALANLDYILEKFNAETKPTLEFYSEALMAYLARQKVDSAEKIMTMALDDFGDLDYLLPMQLKLARIKEENGKAMALMTRCNLTGENDLIDACKEDAQKQSPQENIISNFLK